MIKLKFLRDWDICDNNKIHVFVLILCNWFCITDRSLKTEDCEIKTRTWERHRVADAASRTIAPCAVMQQAVNYKHLKGANAMRWDRNDL